MNILPVLNKRGELTEAEAEWQARLDSGSAAEQTILTEDEARRLASQALHIDGNYAMLLYASDRRKRKNKRNFLLDVSTSKGNRRHSFTRNHPQGDQPLLPKNLVRMIPHWPDFDGGYEKP